MADDTLLNVRNLRFGYPGGETFLGPIDVTRCEGIVRYPSVRKWIRFEQWRALGAIAAVRSKRVHFLTDRDLAVDRDRGR